MLTSDTGAEEQEERGDSLHDDDVSECLCAGHHTPCVTGGAVATTEVRRLGRPGPGSLHSAR